MTTIERFAEARYLGQNWELDTPVIPQRFCEVGDLDCYVNTFHHLHERVFAVRDPGSPVETISWKARLTIPLPKPHISHCADGALEPNRRASSRRCFFGDGGAVEAPIYKATSLTRNTKICGPAIIEEPTTTLVIYPDMAVTISSAGNYLLEAS